MLSLVVDAQRSLIFSWDRKSGWYRVSGVLYTFVIISATVSSDTSLVRRLCLNSTRAPYRVPPPSAPHRPTASDAVFIQSSMDPHVCSWKSLSYASFVLNIVVSTVLLYLYSHLIITGLVFVNLCFISSNLLSLNSG